MHIAHFTNTYKPNLNGVARSVSTFRGALARMGHQVFVFAQEARDYEDDEPFIFRYPGFGVPYFDYSFTLPMSPHIDWVFPYLKVDVIHSNHPVLLGKVAVDKAEKYNLPLVFTFHSRYTEYSQYLPINQSFLRRIIVEALANYIPQCQHVVTPNESIRQSLREYGGVTERVTTIPTGIELEPYLTASGEVVRQKYGVGEKRLLVSIGRLALEKNWKTLIAAFSEVISAADDVLLMLIGDGLQRGDLEDYAKDLGVHQRIIFTGQIPFEEVPDYLQAGNLFCFASVAETQGLVSMEALAAGLPVVAVNAAGTRDTVDDGIQGLLTDNDSHALAQAILQVLADEALLRRFQAEALQKAAFFDIKYQAEKLLSVYEQAIEDKAAGRSVVVDRDLLKDTRDQLGLSLSTS